MTTWLEGVVRYTEPFGAAALGSVALGGNATALGPGAVAMGYKSVASPQNSLAMMGSNVSQ